MNGTQGDADNSAVEPASSEPQRIQDPQFGYKTAVNLVTLVSTETYARFNAMLTIHGFLLASVGLFLTNASSPRLGAIMVTLVACAGVALCCTWRGFVKHGIDAQSTLRQEARRLEDKYFDDSVAAFSTLARRGLMEENSLLRPAPTFEKSAKSVITIFLVLYVLLFVLSLTRFVVLLLRAGSLTITISLLL
jgi:hypothetical protein